MLELRSLLCVLAVVACACERRAGPPSSVPATEVSPSTAAEPEAPAALSLTYVGNEGVLLQFPREGNQTVDILVDAVLAEGLPGYVVPTPEVRGSIERREPPFDRVSLVLATHHHADHFEARAALRVLAGAPELHMMTTAQARERMREADPEGFAAVSDRVEGLRPSEDEPIERRIGPVIVRAFAMHHGRDRAPLVENLGFLVSVDGHRVLHVGDTMVSPQELTALPLAPGDVPVDIVMVPYWHLYDDWIHALVDTLRPEHIVAIHVPAPDAPADYFDEGGYEGLMRALGELSPPVVVLEHPGSTQALALSRAAGDR